MKKNLIWIVLFSSISVLSSAQSFPSISGSLGVTHEHYDLSVNPDSPGFYRPRRPWDQVRFNIAPTFHFSKYFSLPLNFNFSTKATNSLGPFAALSSGSMSFKQFITNPMNNFSINPKYKWAEMLIGTQYLNYTELTTGDIGIFGVGVHLLPPKNNVLRAFYGTSQQAINPALPTNLGAYTRNHWMVQAGKEKENRYTALLTVAKGRDKDNSTSPFPLLPNPANVDPQESFVFSLKGKYQTKKGLYSEVELAQGTFTTNTQSGPPSAGAPVSLKPFMESTNSTSRDYAGNFAVGKKSTHFDIGLKTKYLGAGYRVMGYPFVQPDRLDALINTRFDAWKDKNGVHKMNIVASAGNRINNFSGASGTRAKQLIANVNWFTQFSDLFNLNISYNNFGFSSNGSSSGLPTVKNVSNDFSISPTLVWNGKKTNHVLTFNYGISKYKELIQIPGSAPSIVNNFTHTAMLNYLPTFSDKKATPEFSALYFRNMLPGFTMQLLTLGSGVSAPLFKNKIIWKGQVQYTIGKNSGFTNNNNLLVSTQAEIALHKKLNLTVHANSSLFQFGNELVGPPMLNGANYMESFLRTGLVYKFKK